MTRNNVRWTALLVLAVLLGAAAGVAVAPGSPTARAESAPELEIDPRDIAEEMSQVADPGADDEPAKPAPAEQDAVGGDDSPARGEAVAAFKLHGAAPASADSEAREALLAEWERLNGERKRLLNELQAVHEQMGVIAEELWHQELDGARERLRDQLNEFGDVYGDDIVEWLPPRLIEHIAALTDRTPDEVREMLRNGAWGDLL